MRVEQTYPSMPEDGGFLPRPLICCGGITWAVIAGAAIGQPEHFHVVEQHELWCAVANPFTPPGLTARL